MAVILTSQSGLQISRKLLPIQVSLRSGFPGLSRADRASRWARSLEMKYGGNHL
jgi:hypothetical protein